MPSQGARAVLNSRNTALRACLMTTRFICFLALVTAGLALGACTFTLEPAPRLDREPLVDKLPIAIGVLYGDELRDYVYVNSVNWTETWESSLGPPSIALFDEIFSFTFEDTLPVQSKPPIPGSDADRLTGVIALRIDWVRTSCGGTYADCSAKIKYAFTLYAMDGSEIANWWAEGHSKGNFEWEVLAAAMVFMQYAILDNRMEDLLAEAMQAAGARFWLEFHDDPDVQRWLDQVIVSRRPVER